MSFTQIEEKALAKVLPKIDRDVVTRVTAQLQELIVAAKCDAQVFIGGSFAKNTYLDGDFDIDIFIRFAYDAYKKKDISKILADILSPLNPELIHGSRDYFTVSFEGFALEIVPVLFIDDPKDALNLTDCSPLHVAWTVERITEKPGIENHIRLFKLFCKSAGVYGAESYISGLSGHVVDILVLFFGGFAETLEGLRHVHKYALIDSLSSAYADGLSVSYITEKTGIIADKIVGPLVIIDPIAHDRNAAAAFGFEKFALLQKRIKAYMSSPDASFFVHTPLDEKMVLEQHEHVLKLTFDTVHGKKDIIGSKVLKAIEQLVKQLRLHGFETSFVWEFRYEKNMAYCYLLPTAVEIEKEFLAQGPPLDKTDHVAEFRKAHEIVKEIDGRLFAVCSREYTSFLDAVRHLLVFDKEKISEVKISQL